MYVKSEAIRRHNDKAIEEILNGEIATGLDIPAEEQKIREEQNTNGTQRFFIPSKLSDMSWKDLFKDFEWTADVEVTGEAQDKQTILLNLNTMFQNLVRLNGRPMTAEEKLSFNKILDTAGSVSPLELAEIKSAPVISPIMPNGGKVGMGSSIATQ